MIVKRLSNQETLTDLLTVNIIRLEQIIITKHSKTMVQSNSSNIIKKT